MSEKLCVNCSSSEISPEGIYCKELDRWVGRCNEQKCVLGQRNQQKEGMTNEEALAHFKNHEYMTDFSWQDEMSEVAIKAIEKQIPKKPKRIEYVDGGAEDDCPNCGKRICMVFGNGDTFRWQMPCCCDCGQALKWDWTEGEEA